MNNRFKAVLMLVLAGFLVTAQAEDGSPNSKKSAAKKEQTVSEQIEALRTEFQNKIDALQQEIADRDAKLAAAQAAADAANAKATDASAKADSVSSSMATDNDAVSKLSGAVDDLKANSASIVQTVQDTQKSINTAISHPDTIHYKGVTISPQGSFLAGETVNRSAAIGDDINTHWTSIPLQYAQNAQMSEFYGSGRQSRVAIKATGNAPGATLTGYYEMDWLGGGVTSNNNQSNSYVLRQRQLWARAEFNSGWNVSAGQMWSLATETTQGETNGTEILPATIDAAYEPGFVWTRQYGFRVYKNFASNKFTIGAAAENAEMLNPACAGATSTSCPTDYVFGTTGDTGGLYDNQSNYSFNRTPDFIVKATADPGWGHYELFGIERNFRDRIYPTGVVPHNDSEVGAGIGGGFRAPVTPDKKVTIGAKGLWGQGVGRYGDSTIADVTVRSNGTLEPLHGFSALSTVELNPTKKLNVYLNYGGDYIARDLTGSSFGYGSPLVPMTGCNTEPTAASSVAPAAPGTCGANTKAVTEATVGYWFTFYNGPAGRFRQGFQYSYAERLLWSGVGGTTTPSGVTGIANPNGGAKGIDNMIFTSLRYYLP